MMQVKTLNHNLVSLKQRPIPSSKTMSQIQTWRPLSREQFASNTFLIRKALSSIASRMPSRRTRLTSLWTRTMMIVISSLLSTKKLVRYMTQHLETNESIVQSKSNDFFDLNFSRQRHEKATLLA